MNEDVLKAAKLQARNFHEKLVNIDEAIEQLNRNHKYELRKLLDKKTTIYELWQEAQHIVNQSQI